jgi:hypothetical protein
MVRPFVQIAPPVYHAEDFTNLATLTHEQQLQRLQALDAAGQTVRAIAAVRRLYGYDLAGAQKFVQGLSANEKT